jgi:competence protein ComEC
VRPPILHLTLAYGAGLWAGLVLSIPPAVGVVGAAAGLASAASGTWPAILVAASGIGLLTGSVGRRRRAAACARVWHAGPHAATVLVHDRAGERGLTTASVLSAPEGCAGLLALRTAPGALPAGARAVLVGVFRAPTLLRVDHARVLAGPRALRFRLRDRAARRIERLYGPRAPLVKALVLGARDDLDPKWRQTFADAGVAHLLAISGLHVGIVAAWVALAAGAVVRREWAAWLAVAFTWTYVGLLGLTAPAVRAAALVTVAAAARLRHRHPPPEAILAVTALAVLVADPLAATEVGAWLSVAATWGTGGAVRWLHRRAGRGRGGPRSPVLVLCAASVGATLATAPLAAFAFGSVAPIGVVTNLVVVPLAGLAVPAVFASLLVGGPLAAGAGLVLAAIERVATIASTVPLGRIEGVPGLAFALPWALLLAAVVWAARHPWLPRTGWARAIALGAVGAWAAAAVPALIARSRDRGFAIFVLDVGQGDGIVLRTPHGHWVVVDGGPHTPVEDAGRSIILPFLRRHGVHGLDLVVATHGDADHLGGIPAIIAALVPDLVIEPGQPDGTPLYLAYLRSVDAAGVDWRAARAGDTILLDSVRLAVLHPSTRWMATHLATNENCVVLRVSYGRFDAVLTGDAGIPAESALVKVTRPSEVLKVGHHGSAGATGEAWVEAVRPRVAVISVGAHNRYGHPSPQVLRRLAAHGIAVFRTDRGGTVTIRSDGRYFEVTQGMPPPFPEAMWCWVRRLLPSSGSSSSRNACAPRRRASFPTFSTTSPSPPRSSRATSAGPASSM